MANIETLTTWEVSRAKHLLREATGSIGDRRLAAPGSPAESVFELRSPLNEPVILRLVAGRPPAGRRDALSNTVLVVRKAPTSLLERLRREHASFVDIGRGIVRLEVPGLLIDRTDLRQSLPRPKGPPGRPLRGPFGDRASLVTRLLARTPGRGWRLRELAAAAKVSTMTASHAVRQLEAIGAVEVTASGRAKQIRLANLPALMEHWSYHYDWTKNPRVPLLAPVGEPQRFLSRLPQLLGQQRWALTMHAGASLIAPIAAWGKIHVYVRLERGQTVDDLADALGYEPGDDGALVLMKPWYHDSVWTDVQTIQGLSVVSPLQLVLDLWRYPVRGREQAEHILRTVTGGPVGS